MRLLQFGFAALLATVAQCQSSPTYSTLPSPAVYTDGSFNTPNHHTQQFTEGSTMNVSWSTNYSSSNLYLIRGQDYAHPITVAISTSQTWDPWTVDANGNASLPFLFRVVNADGTQKELLDGGFVSAQFWITGVTSSSTTSSTTTMSTSTISSASAPATSTPGQSAATTTASSTPSPAASSSGLSSGTKVGLGAGIGVGLGIVGIAAAAMFYFFRRRHSRKQNLDAAAAANNASYQKESDGGPGGQAQQQQHQQTYGYYGGQNQGYDPVPQYAPHYAAHSPNAPAEVPGESRRVEAPGESYSPVELPGQDAVPKTPVQHEAPSGQRE